jgi:putative hydroxymethylpyrimidine transport system permease protein
MNDNVNTKSKDRLPAVILVIALIAAWQIAAEAINMKHILPSPLDIVLKIWELRESLFLHHLPSTLATVGAGWGLAIALGIALASLMHFSEHAEAMLKPALTITQTIPVMCISPLFVLWLGYTLPARLLAVVLSTFFAITLNTFEGFKSADPKKKEWLKTCGASKKEIFCLLEIPSALPKFFTALKMTLPWAVIDAAVAEWLGATEGLGYFSKRMISRMDGAAVFAPIVILCVIALVGMSLLKHFDKKHITWRNEV